MQQVMGTFRCPECRSSLTVVVSAAVVGKDVCCPECGEVAEFLSGSGIPQGSVLDLHMRHLDEITLASIAAIPSH